LKILFLDIESQPYTALVWGVRKQYLTSKNLLDTGGILCFAASWADSDYVMFDSVKQSGTKGMLESIHKLMDEADVIVTYNGNGFDIPMLNREFLKYGFSPPAPYRSVDLYRTVRNRFRFASNKLDDVLQELGFAGKTKHRGLLLWLDCMQGKRDAWKEMETYNVNDTVELENLYYRILPWISNHPNRAVYDDAVVCPKCGGKHLQSRGWSYTQAFRYRRFQCKSCGGWARSSKREPLEVEEKLVQVA
jgi:hypothetical protein